MKCETLEQETDIKCNIGPTMSEQELNIKYNIQNIKLFLNIFGLEIEQKSEYKKGDTLLVFMNDIESGFVILEEDVIRIETNSLYGKINAKTNYAKALALIEQGNHQGRNTLGLYANWNNNFDFSLDLLKQNKFWGNICLAVEIDNEFKNTVNCHSILYYQDRNKTYEFIFQEDGYPFQFTEKKENYKEQIIYNIFNTWGTGSYFEHRKCDKFTDGIANYDYDECAFIGETSNKNKKKNIAVRFIEFGNKRMHRTYQEFEKLSDDDEDSREIISRIETMNFLDPSMREKLNKIIAEFSIKDNSFIEMILLYSFTNFSREEVKALFGLDEKFDLRKTYFECEDGKTIGSKIFTRNSNK